MQQIRSPNFSFREGYKPEICVIHITEGNRKSVISEFSSFSTQKSSHYLVCKDGEIIQFVPELLSAWTQGIVNNPTNEIVIQHTKSRININNISISIEHEGYANQPLTPVQYETSAKLILDICQRNNIPLDCGHIVKHNEINNWKTCPGIINMDYLILRAKELQNPPISLIPPENAFQISLLKRILELYQKLLALLQQEKTLGAARNWRWPKVRREHLNNFPMCAVCGGIDKIEVHHIKPFYSNPELELLESNLLTLCESGKNGIVCHRAIGHLGSYQSINKDVIVDAGWWKEKIVNRP